MRSRQPVRILLLVLAMMRAGGFAMLVFQRVSKPAFETACEWCGEPIYVGDRILYSDERTVLEALKAAGFHWSGGSWCGYRARIPEGVLPA